MTWPQVGDNYAGFRLVGVLGEGGTGTVFRALARDQRTEIALKILKPPPGGTYPADVRARLDREIDLVRGLRSPHSVRLLEHGESRGLLFVAFELVAGQDLSEILKQRGTLTPDETRAVLEQLLHALEEAHRHGVIHRDIKPENIRLGEHWQVKLLDFGIARRSNLPEHGSITKTGDVVGTPRYMAPEQILGGRITPASDIYALGLVAIEMLAGRGALHGGSWAEQEDRLMPGYVFDVPDAGTLGSVIRRMTAHAPADRYQSAASVVHALAGGPSTTVARTGAEPASRIPQAVIAGIVVTVLAIAGALVLVGGDTDESTIERAPRRAGGTALVKTYDAATPEPSALDTSDAAAAADAYADAEMGSLRVRFCTEPGWREQERKLTSLLGARHWFVHLPRDFDTSRRYPIIVLLHGVSNGHIEFARDGGFTSLADETNGFIVVSILDADRYAFKEPEDAIDVESVIAEAVDLPCADPERVFLVTHGLSGFAAERMTCGLVRAMVMSSFPRVPRADGCATPTAELLSMRSRHVWEQSVLCGKEPKLPPDGREKRIWTRNRCSSTTPSITTPHEGVTCRHHECEVPFESCRLDGGHGWPGLPSQNVPLVDCENGDPLDFPAAAVAWDFFQRMAPE